MAAAQSQKRKASIPPENSGNDFTPRGEDFSLTGWTGDVEYELRTDEAYKPTVGDLFGSDDPFKMVTYQRHTSEASVKCPQGHSILLSRIPWQSGCRWCRPKPKFNGYPRWIIREYYHQVLSRDRPWAEALRPQEPQEFSPTTSEMAEVASEMEFIGHKDVKIEEGYQADYKRSAYELKAAENCLNPQNQLQNFLRQPLDQISEDRSNLLGKLETGK